MSATIEEEYHEVLNECGLPSVGYWDERLLFPDEERARAWIDDLSDGFGIDTKHFSTRKVKIITPVSTMRTAAEELQNRSVK